MIIYCMNDDYGIIYYGGTAGKCRRERRDDDMTMTRGRIFLK